MQGMSSSTVADGGRGDSIITDRVTRLRWWGREEPIYWLPANRTPVTIGARKGCHIRLVDEAKQVSRKHAELRPYEDGWKLHDLESTNGIWRNGYRRLSWALSPGDEIGIGGVKLIAEGERMVALRALLSRFLGWREDRQVKVDTALRSMCEWAAGRCAVVLLGDGDLTTSAHRLHVATVPASPFIAQNESAAATHGTVWASQVPPDLAPMIERQQRGAELSTRVLLQARTEEVARVTRAFTRISVIEFPSMHSRHYELGRILEETCGDCALDLQAPTLGYTSDDIARLSRRAYRDFAHVEWTAKRLVALRAWGAVRGSRELNLSYTALSKWEARYLGGVDSGDDE